MCPPATGYLFTPRSCSLIPGLGVKLSNDHPCRAAALRVVVAVTASLVVLALMSLALIHAIGNPSRHDAGRILTRLCAK